MLLRNKVFARKGAAVRFKMLTEMVSFFMTRATASR